MEELQQRRLEIIRTCLNNLEKYFVGSEVTSLITEAQVQLDKLLSADAPVGASAEVVLPVSPTEAAAYQADRYMRFPQELMRWINQKIMDEYDADSSSSTVAMKDAPVQNDGASWMNLAMLQKVYVGAGWKVQWFDSNVYRFTKRDEKQASSIN